MRAQLNVNHVTYAHRARQVHIARTASCSGGRVVVGCTGGCRYAPASAAEQHRPLRHQMIGAQFGPRTVCYVI